MANPVAKADRIAYERPGIDRVLMRLASPERLVYGAPLAAGVAEGDLFCAVLREIDETILPRELIVESQMFGTIRLSVSNRRLSAIRFDHDTDQSPMVEAENSQEMAEQFAEILMQAFAVSEEARILRPRRMPPGTVFNMSCSAESLAEAAGILDFRVGAMDEIAGFTETVQKMALAYAEGDRDTVILSATGKQDDIDLLDTFFRNFQAGQANGPKTRRFNPDEPRCLMVPLVDARTVVLALRQTGHQLAVVPNESTATLIQAWHAERGGS